MMVYVNHVVNLLNLLVICFGFVTKRRRFGLAANWFYPLIFPHHGNLWILCGSCKGGLKLCRFTRTHHYDLLGYMEEQKWSKARWKKKKWSSNSSDVPFSVGWISACEWQGTSYTNSRATCGLRGLNKQTTWKNRTRIRHAEHHLLFFFFYIK